MTGSKHRIALVFLACLSLATACGDDNPANPIGNITNENSLVFTRPDQSKVTFANGTQLYVWCGPWEQGFIATPAVHVEFFGSGPTDNGWLLTAVVADVKIGTPLAFPNEFIFGQPKNADLFIVDGSNELSTNRLLSSGSITFQKLNCASGGRVEFTIAATVASEFGGGPSLSVSGRLSAPVGQAPH
ncbi:MAG: hypothetical protein ABI852_05700 [Gemmatimonadaceae bacterium]